MKHFTGSAPEDDIMLLVLRSDTKESGDIIKARDGLFPRGIYLLFKAT